MNDLTEIQKKVLHAIILRIKLQHIPPTHRELSLKFHWRSNSSAKCHLLALEKKGFIRTHRMLARGIEITPAGWDWFNTNSVGA